MAKVKGVINAHCAKAEPPLEPVNTVVYSVLRCLFVAVVAVAVEGIQVYVQRRKSLQGFFPPAVASVQGISRQDTEQRRSTTLKLELKMGLYTLLSRTRMRD